MKMALKYKEAKNLEKKLLRYKIEDNSNKFKSKIDCRN